MNPANGLKLSPERGDMSTKSDAFVQAAKNEPHQDRTRAILKEHPEIVKLTGNNPATFAFIVGLTVMQVGLAYWVRDRPWWLIVLGAYVAGAFLTNGLFVLMHECNHNLVFKKRRFNMLAGIFANLCHVLPSCVSFQRYHLTHHAFQGVHELDGDMPSVWEANLVGRSAIRKALWLLFYPVILAFRPAHVREVYLFSPWTVFNILVVLGFNVAVFVVLGPKSLVYLVLCMFFAIGLHPLGARWIQEHYVMSPPQETYSYYGWLNYVAFNIGYHNEHHDFPAIPWNRVPRVRRLASSWYDSLVSHRSLTKLLFKFLTDRNLTLFSRVRRSERGVHELAFPARADMA